MSNVLHRIHRIRRLREREARLALADAEIHRDALVTEVQRLESSLHRARGLLSETADQDAAANVFSLRTEMIRRGRETELGNSERVVTDHRARVSSARTEAKVVERLVELRATRIREAVERKAQGTLDETAIQMWNRTDG